MNTGKHPPAEADRHKQGISVAEAAAISGLHKNTIRSYIKRGKLHAALVNGTYGPEYRLSPDDILDDLGKGQPRKRHSQVSDDLDTARGMSAELSHELVDVKGVQEPAKNDEARNDQSKAGSSSAESNSLEPLASLIRDIQEENRQLAGQLGFLQSENGQLKEQLKLLTPPPPPEPSRKTTDRLEDDGATAEIDRAGKVQRRWWKVWQWGRT